MSGLAALYNVPGDDDERNDWSFSHMANHRDIAKAIYLQFGVTLPEYSLDPIPLNDPAAWTYQHQLIHNEINQVLGTSGFNLLNVDWKNPALLAGFIQSNATTHVDICNTLGIA